MATQSSDKRKDLRNQYQNRVPQMGVVCCRAGSQVWVGMSRDVSATLNSQQFQLEMGSSRNRQMQQAYNADPASLQWSVVRQVEIDPENPQDNYDEDLELLLMEAMDEFPEAKRISSRKFC